MLGSESCHVGVGGVCLRRGQYGMGTTGRLAHHPPRLTSHLQPSVCTMHIRNHPLKTIFLSMFKSPIPNVSLPIPSTFTIQTTRRADLFPSLRT